MADINAFKKNQETKVIDTTRKLRIGIIGTGGIANAHMRIYLEQPDVEVVAGCDIIPGKAKAFFEAYNLDGIKTDYKNHEEMLDDESLKLDAVSICTYNSQHTNCALYALKKKIHVLIEKPFTVTLDEAVEIVRAEKESGCVMTVGFQPRGDENMKMIKKIVESGELGQIYYIQTGGGRRRGIPVNGGKTSFIEKDKGAYGALGDIGCYSLDMVLNAIGYPKPLTVSGYLSDFFGKDPNYCTYVKENTSHIAKMFGVDDFAAAFVRLEGGIILDFRIAWAMNIDTPGDTIILGTKGGLRIPSTPHWGGSVGGNMTVYHEVAGEQVETVIPILENSENIWTTKIRSFLEAIKNGTPSPVPSQQMLYNQAILDGIAKSAEIGREVEIVIPEI